MGNFYQPEKLEDIVGHERQKEAVQVALDRGRFNNHILLKGSHGVGKSSFARAIMNESTSDDNLDKTWISAARRENKEILEKIQTYFDHIALGGQKIIVIDEIDEIRKNYQTKLEPLLDPVSPQNYSDTVVIATTNCIENKGDLTSKLWDIFDHRHFKKLSDDEIREFIDRMESQNSLDLDKEFIDQVVEKADGKPRRAKQVISRYE